MRVALQLGLLLLLSFFTFHFSFAQEGSAEWSARVEPVEEADSPLYEVVFEARETSGWHLYDMGPYKIPGLATEFVFETVEGVELVGEAYEIGEPIHRMDETFGFETGFYEGTARFGQWVRLVAVDNGATAPVLAGEVEYQICMDAVGCIRGVWEFNLVLSQEPADATQTDARQGMSETQPAAGGGGWLTGSKSPRNDGADGVVEAVVSDGAPSAATGNLWSMILEAILWGFAALLTPCVFPMVPMTVSFFMKDAANAAANRFKAITFGLFIIGLYTLPIAVIILATYFAGGEAVTADIFNWLATHWIPNVLFFVVFMLFAASLLGAFEMRMPSKLVNRSDRGAEKGGLVGVFFLALTLVLVSFSCTGPIVGTVLIKSTQGEFWAPILTMMVFSAAFALPFTLLAIFPRLMERLPRSGGWLNSVKVILGLVEIALGLKFLSVADQTYHWGILPREIYLAVWIVVFSMLGLYLLGKLRFKYDSPVESVGVGRLAGAIVVFSFVVWLVPGMWGAPLSKISGYLPPISGQEFVSGVASGRSERGGDLSALRGAELRADGISAEIPVKYADILSLPHGLTGYFDYEQGLAAAREQGKPVFLDFTGHGCVNCREMEARVWVSPRVLEILREEYVVLALYSDDRTQLPETEWVTTAAGKTLKTLGRVNSYLVNTRYGVSAQPAYLLLDPATGEPLAPVYGYDLSVDNYVAFLRGGVEAYNKAR